MTGYKSKRAAAQAKLEPPARWAYAVIEMRVGDALIRHYLSQEQMQDAIDPWLLMELCAKRCIRELKERRRTHD